MFQVPKVEDLYVVIIEKLLQTTDMILVRVCAHKAENGFDASVVVLEIPFIVVNYVFVFLFIIMIVDIHHHYSFGLLFAVLPCSLWEMNDGAISTADI